MGRAQDIDPVDFEMVDHTDSPRDLTVAGKIDINFLAQFRDELLRIVQLPMPKFFREDHGRGDDRPG
jgi:hypothetical protein